jgi:hypothetical protein
MVVTAPELVHLEPIVGLIESQMYATRLSRELLPTGKSAVTHRPFQMNFVNGARIIGRIPQKDGKGVKGIHPLWLELDEAQDYGHAGWVELTETLKRGHEGAIWRAHGVTRGLRDDFYEHTQDTPDNEWKVHRFSAMWRPTWTDQERQEKIKQYGSRDDPDYRRNVLGLHGDSTNPLFVLHRLMQCVDQEELSDYNADEYMSVSIKAETLNLMGQDILDVLDFPPRHRSYIGPDPRKPKATYWVGMDVGLTVDPSEILVFVEHRAKPKDDQTTLKLLTRIHLERVAYPDQMKAVLWVIDFYKPRVFSMDKGGIGLPIFQGIQQAGQDDPERYKGVFETIKGYNFAEKIVVDFDVDAPLSTFAEIDDEVRDAGIRRNAKDFSSDVLRTLVDSKRLVLPWDTDLLKQFQGGTWQSARGLQDQYGRRIWSKGNDHILDAARLFALGWAQFSIELLLKKDVEQLPVLDTFVSI